MVRAASEGNKRYFFYLSYLTIEEITNLDNPFIAFICGSLEKVLIIPAKIFKYFGLDLKEITLFQNMLSR